MRRKTLKGSGCGCGAMSMLGFPKSGGFLGLFENTPATTPATSTPVASTPVATSPALSPIVKPAPKLVSNTNVGKNYKMPNTSRSVINTSKNINSLKTNSLQTNTSKNSGLFGLFGGYRATKKNKKYLKRYKQGKSIGFTMRSSLKAKGLIPRANGTYKVSKKYRG